MVQVGIWREELITFIPFHRQPQIYRSIIDDVIANVQVDFEEYGMEDDVLINLQAVRHYTHETTLLLLMVA